MPMAWIDLLILFGGLAVLIKSADLLVTGAVTAFEPNAGGGGGMLGGLKKKAMGCMRITMLVKVL